MPIRSIEKIKIGNYPDGKFANGYIYSAQISQGYSENSNKLTIDIVYEQGATIVLPDKNLTTSYRVQFGDIVFPQMYFIAHTKSVAVNEETITCTFSDNSILLDRYFVGLTNRHYQVTENNSAFNVNVICANCDNTIGIKNGTVSRSVATSPNLLVNNLLIVGDEEFVDQSCDVPDVKYNFTSLLATMAKIPNFSFKNFIDINPDYKTSYTGTLREVLSNWCSDFGFNFYWDFISNSLICIDLRNPIDLTPVSDFINSNFNQNNANLPISSYAENESLEGTYQQDNIDFVLKPSRVKERQFTDFFPITYNCLTVENAFSNDYFNYGAAFKIGCVLAKYNQQARTLYHLQNNRFGLVGFTLKYNSIESYVLQEVLKNINEFVNSGSQTRIILGYYNQAVDQANGDREAGIASNFIGKYYYNANYIKWKDLYCSNNARLTLSTSVVPEPDCTGPRPWIEYGGTYAPSPVGVNCLFSRGGAAYSESNSNNFNMDNLGPIFTDINGELADQVRNALLTINPNDTNADRYRGLTIIAFKPLLRVDSTNNNYNNAEEGIVPAQYESDQIVGCSTICEKDAGSQICNQVCTRLSSPNNGLVSKLSGGISVTNLFNNSNMNIVFPSEQNYLGYIKAQGTLYYTENGIKSMNLTSATNFQVNPNAMAYSIHLNDITTEEPSVGTVNIKTINQNSKELSIVQNNPKKSISLKIIGMNYNTLNNYLNPQSGLTSLNVYLNDNGVFTDLNFENRPAQKSKPEVVMQKIGPQKIRIIK
jgi:hypothetical protein